MPTSTLLDALGWEQPAQTEIGVDISYATVVVPIPANVPLDWKLILRQPDPPALAMHAVLVPIEGRVEKEVPKPAAFVGRDQLFAFLEPQGVPAIPTDYRL